MNAFDEHKDELEHFEQMYGRERGRLAVSLDRMTNALVLVGQHGVDCTSQRNAAVPAMDLRIITQELEHATPLEPAVMEDLKRAREERRVRSERRLVTAGSCNVSDPFYLWVSAILFPEYFGGRRRDGL